MDKRLEDPARQLVLTKDPSAIVASDPKLKQEINEWAKGKRARKSYPAKPEKSFAHSRDTGGGQRLERAEGGRGT